MEDSQRDYYGNVIPSAPPFVEQNDNNTFQYPGTSWYGSKGTPGYVFPESTSPSIMSNEPGPAKTSMNNEILRELHEVHTDINQRLEEIALQSEKHTDRLVNEISNKLDQISGQIPRMHYDMLNPQHIGIAQRVSDLRGLERKNHGLLQIVMRRR